MVMRFMFSSFIFLKCSKTVNLLFALESEIKLSVESESQSSDVIYQLHYHVIVNVIYQLYYHVIVNVIYQLYYSVIVNVIYQLYQLYCIMTYYCSINLTFKRTMDQV